MSITKYVKSLVIPIFLILFTCILFISLGDAPGFSPIFLVDSLGLQMLYFITWIWVGPLIGIFFGYLLAPFFLLVHKKVIGSKMTYGVQEVVDPNPGKFKGAFKGFFPSLMALNFAIMFSINPFVIDILAMDGDTSDPVNLVLGVMILLALTSGVAIALFSPIWFLLDSGIIYSNKKKLEKRKIPPEIRSVGGWYLYLIKGYAGISVLFAFYSIITRYIEAESGNIPGIIFFLGLPLLITFLMVPSVVVFDIIEKHRREFILKYAKKIGIIDNVKVQFEITNQ